MPSVIISLSNLRTIAAVSRGTQCYSASVLVDGVRVGVVENKGDGGASFLRPVSMAAHVAQLISRATAFATSQTWEWNGERHPYTFLEDYLDALVEQEAYRKALERDCKRTLKRSVLVLMDGRIMKTAAAPGVCAALRALHGEAIVILNELPLPEAVALYVATASAPDNP